MVLQYHTVGSKQDQAQTKYELGRQFQFLEFHIRLVITLLFLLDLVLCLQKIFLCLPLLQQRLTIMEPLRTFLDHLFIIKGHVQQSGHCQHSAQLIDYP